MQRFYPKCLAKVISTLERPFGSSVIADIASLKPPMK